jgi:hypothetical protein
MSEGFCEGVFADPNGAESQEELPEVYRADDRVPRLPALRKNVGLRHRMALDFELAYEGRPYAESPDLAQVLKRW